MKTLKQVEADVRMLPLEKQAELRDWLENLLEDRLKMTDEFKAKINRGESDFQEGRVRFVKKNQNQGLVKHLRSCPRKLVTTVRDKNDFGRPATKF